MGFIPTSNIDLCADVASNIYGSLSVNAIKLSEALCSVNLAVPDSLLSFGNLCACLTKTPASLTFTSLNQVCSVTVTANSAWCASITAGGTYYQLYHTTGKVTLSGSDPTGVVGGSGTVAVCRTGVPSGSAGTLTITYSNQAGSTTTTTVSISSFA